MKEELCGDCRYARNERPNLEQKRRDFDCVGGPALQLPLGVQNGQMMVANIRGGVVGGRDPACALFKFRPLAAGLTLAERISAYKDSPTDPRDCKEEPPKEAA